MSWHASIVYWSFPAKRRPGPEIAYHKYECCLTRTLHRELSLGWFAPPAPLREVNIPLSRRCSCRLPDGRPRKATK